MESGPNKAKICKCNTLCSKIEKALPANKGYNFAFKNGLKH